MDAAALAWARAAGVRVHACAPAALPGDPSERGMFATAAVEAGEVLVAVPAVAVLTAPAARAAAPAWRAAVEAGPPVPPATELAAFLVWAAATPEAPWHLYSQTLPPAYTLAMTFGEDDAELLGAPFAVDKAKAAAAAAQADADAAAALLACINLHPSRSTIIAALCAVRSRAMHHPACPAGAMLPVGDLFNHAPPRPPQPPVVGGDCRSCAGWHGERGACPEGGEEAQDDASSSLPESWGDGAWVEEEGVFCVRARTTYPPSSQIFLSYGALSNWDAVEHYGYVPSNNPCDTAPVPVETVTRALPKAQVEPGDSFFHATGQPSWRLLAAARLATAPRGGDKGRVAAGLAVDAAGDAAALRGLAVAAADARRSLPPPRPAPPGRPAAAVAVAWRQAYEAVLARAEAVCGRAASAAAVAAAGRKTTAADFRRKRR